MSSFDAKDVLDRFPALGDAYVSATGMRGSPYPTPPSTSTPPSTGYRTPPGTRYLIHNDLRLRLAREPRPAVVYNFASGACQRAHGRRRSAITPDQLTEPATQPHTRALRIVSRQLPWRTEVRASQHPYVTVGDVLRAVRETAALPVNEPEFNIVSSPRRHGIRAAFRRRGGREFLLRADALEDCSYLGGMAQDDGFVAKFHNAIPSSDEPPVFVMKFVDLAAALERAGLEPASSRPTSRWQ
ncbi:hypothetical protein AURDEDRAFT_152136 [Auricularia subglabra TFB-10046 SS5]|nr:hypothetical protein AURDEDRAFT_152136 [Auricularia subglabra TFB-10046 SS5]